MDDKRFIRNDGIHTYAWGHCSIINESRPTTSNIESLENEFISFDTEAMLESEFLAVDFSAVE